MKCPVCNIISSNISRHIMNKKDILHKEFRLKQDKLILNTNKGVIQLSKQDNIFCSPAYIRKLLKRNIDFKKFLHTIRSNDTSKQYKDGRRNPNIKIAGWKPKTIKDYGKRVLSQEKINKIKTLFNSDLTIKDVSKLVGCNNKTTYKYWIEFYGKNKTSKRNRDVKIKNLSVIDKKIKKSLRIMFFTSTSLKEIASKCNISKATVRKFYSQNFSKEDREERLIMVRKEGLRKSLIKCGKNGISGSEPENLCYKLLKQSFNVKHHDLDICEPYEIDITIPSKKIAIFWDGPFHRKSIFGENKLKRVKERDNDKIERLCKIGWKVIIIDDDCSKVDKYIVNKTVSKIIENLHKDFNVLRIKNVS